LKIVLKYQLILTRSAGELFETLRTDPQTDTSIDDNSRYKARELT